MCPTIRKRVFLHVGSTGRMPLSSFPVSFSDLSCKIYCRIFFSMKDWIVKSFKISSWVSSQLFLTAILFRRK